MLDAIRLPPPELYKHVKVCYIHLSSVLFCQNGIAMLLYCKSCVKLIALCTQELAGEELTKALQIKSKISRRKAISSLEEKVLTILTEKGYVIDEVAFGTIEAQPDLLEDEDEDEEVVPEGEVDQGDVHIRPIPRKPIPLVSLLTFSTW